MLGSDAFERLARTLKWKLPVDRHPQLPTGSKLGDCLQCGRTRTGEASIALLSRYLSASRLVTIAQIEGRVRAADSEFVFRRDMRFAARESAIFSLARNVRS